MLNFKFVDGTVDVSGGNDSSDREQKLERHPLLPAAKGGKVKNQEEMLTLVN